MNYKIEIVKTSRYYYINAISETDDRIGKVCIDLDSEDATRYKKFGNKLAKLILVSTSINACGNGVATALLNKTIEVLNDYNIYLNVVPLPRDTENNKYRTKEGLANFYSKFGFKRYNEDICVTTMIRLAA